MSRRTRPIPTIFWCLTRVTSRVWSLPGASVEWDGGWRWASVSPSAILRFPSWPSIPAIPLATMCYIATRLIPRPSRASLNSSASIRARRGLRPGHHRPGRDTGHRVLGEGAAARTWKKIFRFHPPPAFSDHDPEGPGSRWPSCYGLQRRLQHRRRPYRDDEAGAVPAWSIKGSQCTFTLSCSKADKAIGTQPLSQR
jgi:hypothetical protein